MIKRYRTRGLYCCVTYPSSPIPTYLQHVLHILPSALPPPCSKPLLWFCHLIWMIGRSFLTSPSASVLTPLQPILRRKLECSSKNMLTPIPFPSLHFSVAFLPVHRKNQKAEHNIESLPGAALAHFLHSHPVPPGSCYTGRLSAPKMYQLLLSTDPLNRVLPLPAKSVHDPALLSANLYSSCRFQCQYYFLRMNHSNEYRFPYCFLS